MVRRVRAAGTPTALLDRLHTDINTVLRMPEIQQRLNDLLGEAAPISREEFDQFIRADIARWARVIKDAGIALQ